MNISETCIRRPVLTTLMTASLIVFGIFAYRLLPVAALPAVDFPTIQITAQFPGASPETMASSVASPIERQLSTISGITSMNSSSSLGLAQITIQFDLGRNIDGAALDVQTALATSARLLPIEMTIPPSFRKVNPGDFPVLYVSLRSDTVPLSTVDDYAETVLAPQLSQLPGVAQVLVYGAQKFAVRVQVNPIEAAARNIALEDVRSVVAKANSSTPVGVLTGPKQSVTLAATSAMPHAADYRDVVVTYRNGAPVKLNQIARVIDSVENDKVATWFNDARAIVLAIQRQPDANTVQVVDLVRQALPAMRAQVPPSIQMEPLFDRSLSIRAAVIDVQETLAIAITLVIMVIFLFLRKVSATIIPALAVPVSLVGTFAAMYAFGFSINNMTLLALTLSVGFVVDDAIVMLENIVRHIEGGMRPFEAALKGSREIGFTIVSITFSLIAVFIPVLLMGGMVGRVFREFAVSIAVAIVVSGFVSLTLTPMLCARVLGSHHPEGEKQFLCCGCSSGSSSGCSAHINGRSTRCWPSSRSCWESPLPRSSSPSRSISWCPRDSSRRRIPATSSVSPKVRPTFRFRQWSQLQRKVADLVRADPAVAYVNSTVGTGGPNSVGNSGRMLVALKPRKERDDLQTILARLRRNSNSVPGHRDLFPADPEHQSRRQAGQEPISVHAAIQRHRRRSIGLRRNCATRFRKIDGLLDVTIDLYVRNPQVTIDVDREKAAVYGVTVDQVRQELYNAFGVRQVATIYTPGQRLSGHPRDPARVPGQSG